MCLSRGFDWEVKEHAWIDARVIVDAVVARVVTALMPVSIGIVVVVTSAVLVGVVVPDLLGAWVDIGIPVVAVAASRGNVFEATLLGGRVPPRPDWRTLRLRAQICRALEVGTFIVDVARGFTACPNGHAFVPLSVAVIVGIPDRGVESVLVGGVVAVVVEFVADLVGTWMDGGIVVVAVSVLSVIVPVLVHEVRVGVSGTGGLGIHDGGVGWWCVRNPQHASAEQHEEKRGLQGPASYRVDESGRRVEGDFIGSSGCGICPKTGADQVGELD